MNEVMQRCTPIIAAGIINALMIGLFIHLLLLVLLNVAKSYAAAFQYRLSVGAVLLHWVAFIGSIVYNPELFGGSAAQSFLETNTNGVTTGSVLIDGPAIQSSQLTIGLIRLWQDVSTYLSILGNRYGSFITIVYAITMFFMVVRLLVGYRRSRTLGTNNIEQVGEAWILALQDAKQKLGIRREIAIVFSKTIVSPCVVGCFKSIVLIPLSLATRLTTHQMEAVLLHEVAHIRRYDMMLAVFMRVSESVLCFNPFVWLASRKAGVLMEYACDEMAAGNDRHLELAESLKIIGSHQQQLLALSFSNNRRHLFNRIQQLLLMKKQPTAKDNRKGLLATLCAIVVIIFITFSWAQMRDQWSGDVAAGSLSDSKMQTINYTVHSGTVWVDVQDFLKRGVSSTMPFTNRKLKADKNSNDSYTVSHAFTDSIAIKNYDEHVRKNGIPDFVPVLRRLVKAGYADDISFIRFECKHDKMIVNNRQLPVKVESELRNMLAMECGAIVSKDGSVLTISGF